jgi:bifunctional non-homologous end joining protein LigD
MIYPLSHPDKLLYPEDNISKMDLALYYDFISPLMLPYLTNRVLTLVRCPENYKECFYQRHYADVMPRELQEIIVEGTGEHENYIYLTDKKGLLSLVQMNVLEIHPWASQISHLENPDWITFDLDPAPDVPWIDVVKAAKAMKDRLLHHQLSSFVKTTGGKGLHVVVPIQPKYDWNVIKNFARVFVMSMEKLNPQHYITTMTKSKRTGKIFLDYLRNQRSASSIAVYSTRAYPHAPISTPLDWDELTHDKRDTDFSIHTIFRRIEQQKMDPWYLFLKSHQVLPMNMLT